MTIKKGIKVINPYYFSCLSHVDSIYLPHSLKRIEQGTFSDDLNVDNIYYDGSEDDWWKIVIEGGNDMLFEKIQYCK